MSQKYQIKNPEGLYFVTFTVINWIDVFIRREYCDIIIDSLRYCQEKKGLLLYTYCIMTSHLHLIVRAGGKIKLPDIIRDFKKYTSSKLIHAIIDNPAESRKVWLKSMLRTEGMKNSNNTRYQFWQQHNHPVELCTNFMVKQRVEYIHNNPLKAGIVNAPENYLFSSAANYSDLPDKMLDIILLEI